jgi:hypothetical protein
MSGLISLTQVRDFSQKNGQCFQKIGKLRVEAPILKLPNYFFVSTI